MANQRRMSCGWSPRTRICPSCVAPRMLSCPPKRWRKCVSLTFCAIPTRPHWPSRLRSVVSAFQGTRPAGSAP